MCRRIFLYVATGISEIIAVTMVLRWATHSASASSILVPAVIALAAFLFLLRFHPAQERAYTVYAGLCLAVVALFFLIVEHVDPKEPPALIWKSGTAH
jgi:drug/metabolite transporter superfamily protein YnfA